MVSIAAPGTGHNTPVVVPAAAPPKRQGSELASRALRGTGIAADMTVVIERPRTAFARRAPVVTFLPAVVREGTPGCAG
jgi:hypothetical protein